jgi:hypothetical protein
MAAITGAQTDRMTRDDGWRLLSIGRHIERLGFLSRSLTLGLETASVHCEAGFEAMVALFDSTITFHAQFQQSREMAALVDLLVLDRDNPRSLAWVAHTLRGRLAKLAGSAQRSPSADVFGNRRTFFSLQAPHDRADASRPTAMSRRRPREPLPDSLAWERVREQLPLPRGRALGRGQRIPLRLAPRAAPRQPSPPMPAPVFTPGRPLLDAARDLMARIHDRIHLRHRQHRSQHPALEALERRNRRVPGLRPHHDRLPARHGPAARYVSGYLLTQPPPGSRA